MKKKTAQFRKPKAVPVLDPDFFDFAQDDVLSLRADLTGPCDDDPEVDCPYVGMLPDESDTEGGSPLDFWPRSYRNGHNRPF